MVLELHLRRRMRETIFRYEVFKKCKLEEPDFNVI